MTAETVVAILAAVGGLSFVGTLITAVASRRKVSADAVHVLSQTAAELVNPLRLELAGARGEVAAARGEMAALHEQARVGFDALHRHLDALEKVLRDNRLPVPERPAVRWPQANGRTG